MPQTGEYFRASDFGLGKVIEFNKHKFEIIEVDEYTKAYIHKKAEDEAKREQMQSTQPKKTPKVNPYVPVTAGFGTCVAVALSFLFPPFPSPLPPSLPLCLSKLDSLCLCLCPVGSECCHGKHVRHSVGQPQDRLA